MSFRAVEVVRQYPGVQFILNHCGLPYERDEHTMHVWKEGEPLVGIIWSVWRKRCDNLNGCLMMRESGNKWWERVVGVYNWSFKNNNRCLSF